MHSVNPFGNSTSPYNVGSIALSPELELLEGTGIDWKSLDSHNIDFFSLPLLLLPESISNLQVHPALFDDVTVVDRSVASSGTD